MKRNPKAEKEYKHLHLNSLGKGVGIVLLGLISLLTLFLLFIGLVDNRDNLATLVDNALSFLFLFLFVSLLWLSNDRRRFIKNNWWLLLGAIPLDWLQDRTGLTLLIANLLAIGRFAVRISLLVRMSRRLIPKTYALLVATALATTVLISTALFYAAEHVQNPNVETYFDSFWWAMVTGATIGYGDITPVTTPGRWVAIFLMVFGLGVFGFVTGSVASMLSNRAKRIANDNKR